MWKLKTIEAENLCAFRSLSYMLRQGVTTLIFGDNRDNESQPVSYTHLTLPTNREV